MKFLVIDGNSILARSFYSTRSICNSKGQYTNAVFGFMKTYYNLTSKVCPDAIAVVFGSVSDNADIRLEQQYPLTKELLQYIGIKVVECENFKIIDVLATLSKLCTDSNVECLIFTGDRNKLQLLSEETTVILARNTENKFYTPKAFRDDYGYDSISIIDYNALYQIPRMREPTVNKLIKNYGTIESIYKNIDNAPITVRARENIKMNESMVRATKLHSAISFDVPVDAEIMHYTPTTMNKQKVSQLLVESEMFMLLDWLHISVTPAAIPHDCLAVIDTETTWNDDVMSIGIVIADAVSFTPIDKKYYIITPECEAGGMYSNRMHYQDIKVDLQSSRENVICHLIEALQSYNVKCLFAYNARFDHRHLPELHHFKWFDIMKLAAYKQYNSKIPKKSECYGTGRLKRNYGVEPIMRILSGDEWYSESHNALYDALDELVIMRLLNHRVDQYSHAQIM